MEAHGGAVNMNNRKKDNATKNTERIRSTGELLVYQGKDGNMRLEVRLFDDTLWLTQAQMAELFATDRSVITKHLRNIFNSGELGREVVCAKFAHTAGDGKQYQTQFYNLDAIISVGYRVNSIRGTQFRIWATERLKEYIVKGFILNDERLKEPEGGRYFEELLARIRDIRSSEKIFWRKVLDIYATSIDYDPTVETSQKFFRQVQNMMHWAAHGRTAAELIYERADALQANMGVTNYPGNTLLKRDVEVAKNYLKQEELDVLNRIVTAYLEVAEIQALNRNPMTMNDWIERLHQFLTMTGRDLLTHAGKISHEEALQKAHQEYEKFRARRLAEPTEAEKHFIEAEKKMNQIEIANKSGGRK